MIVRQWLTGNGYPVMATRLWLPGYGYPAKYIIYNKEKKFLFNFFTVCGTFSK
jgi:hypothetical protein